MLKWKMFVTIMSMVSLTHQVDPFNAGSSSISSPLWVHDEDNGIYYPSSLNITNPFKRGSDAHKCFAILRLYCRTEENEVTSNDCIKQGIFFYRRKYINYHNYRRDDKDPLGPIDRFFDQFPLKKGKFKLPKDFCEEDHNCMKELKEYNDQIETPISQREDHVKLANYLSRKEIAWLSLRYKIILGLDNDSFEKKYLEHISEYISSKNPEYTPENYCHKWFEESTTKMIVSDFLTNYLQL